jgi:hypothetical protein
MAKRLVQDIEIAIQSWLDATDPTVSEDTTGRAINHADSPVIKELSYKPLELVWITDDPFARWIVHCVSRWHGVVSFSAYLYCDRMKDETDIRHLGKDISVPGEGDGGPTIQRRTHLLRPNSRHPDPRAAAAIYTPTATDMESSIVDTEDSDYANLADSISSLQIVEGSDVEVPNETTDGSRVLVPRIKEEAEPYLSDAESSFSLVEHPTEVDPEINGQQSSAAAVINETRETVGRPRAADYAEGINFRPSLSRTMRSDSSPSRSPVRTRRLRHVRRVVAPPRRSQGVFRTVDPPTTFMAYVYGA